MEDNILNPQLIWIESRCYRVNALNGNRDNIITRINYEEEDFDCELELDEDDFLEIEEIENGKKFQLKLHVPQQFHGQIIGQKGTTKKRIEQETSTQLTIPKIGSKETSITIKGFTRKNLISAKNRLDLIVASGRSKIQFTHFLSIAFTSQEIQENFVKFRNQILEDSEIYGIESSLFQKPQKLHLTIATLALLDNEDRSIAAELLQDCKEMIIQPILRDEPFTAKLCGLNYMNDDTSSVDVLYGVVISEKLQEISNAIVEYFVSRGYSQMKHDHVKLHVTLMNSLFRDNDDAIEKDDRDNGKRVTFDATKILKKFKDFYFGELIIKEIHLSQRYSKSSNGFYEATGILKI